MTVVIDTSFISSLFKAGYVNLIKEFFKESEIFISTGVLKELSESEFFSELIPQNKWVKVKKSSAIKNKSLGLGERQTIKLAMDLNAIALIDDRKAKAIAIKKSIKTFDLPQFLLACKETQTINKKQLKKILKKLKEKDHYKLKKTIKKELLK